MSEAKYVNISTRSFEHANENHVWRIFHDAGKAGHLNINIGSVKLTEPKRPFIYKFVFRLKYQKPHIMYTSLQKWELRGKVH